MDRRLRLLSHGKRVLDLGAAPGSWSLYAAKSVGPSGSVLGLDITEHRGALPDNLEMRVVDVFDLDPEHLPGPFDVVLSDMAPATSGSRVRDQFRSYELVLQALLISDKVLAKGGTLVAKIFQGPEFSCARDEVRTRFKECRIMRPEAVRRESFETYLVGLDRKISCGESSKT